MTVVTRLVVEIGGTHPFDAVAGALDDRASPDLGPWSTPQVAPGIAPAADVGNRIPDVAARAMGGSSRWAGGRWSMASAHRFGTVVRCAKARRVR